MSKEKVKEKFLNKIQIDSSQMQDFSNASLHSLMKSHSNHVLTQKNRNQLQRVNTNLEFLKTNILTNQRFDFAQGTQMTPLAS